jgi:transcription antitermination factor NusG
MEIVHIDNLLWFPIRTKPKKEKKLAEYCQAHKIRYYLPVTKSVKRYGRKTVEFTLPMFNGYIFCQLDHELYKLLLRSHGVFFKVAIDDFSEDQLIKDLKNIYQLENLSEDKEIVIKPELAEGVPITIADGPLQGVVGIITRRTNDVVVTVNVDILGQSVSVKMDVGEIELVK